MSMDHELWLQQCRIHQNKDKEPISLSYADADHFYKTLDKYVFDGYKIKISFVLEKLSTGSFLLERIISCLNGKSLIDDYQDIYDNLHDILDFNNQEHFIGAIMQCIDTDNKIYHSYLFKYNDTDAGQPVLSFEPAGEGLPSCSFTVDIQGS